MNRDSLKQIMIDQKEIYLNNPLIPRHYYLEENVNYCFVGIRRTGKSYMMYQQIKQLEANGIPLSQIVYVNFEDERLLEMTAADLNLIFLQLFIGNNARKILRKCLIQIIINRGMIISINRRE